MEVSAVGIFRGRNDLVLTLDANVNVILGLFRFPSVVVGLREGVCESPKLVISGSPD